MAASYVLFSYVTVEDFGQNVDALGKAEIPFIGVADDTLHAFAFFAYLAGLTSTLGVLIAGVNAQARMVFNAGREGLLPAAIGRVHPTRRTPVVALCVFLGFSLLLVFAWGGRTDPLEFFAQSSTLGTILVLVVYLVANLGLPVYCRRYRPAEFSGLRHAVLPLLGVAAIAFPLYELVKPGQPAPYNRFPLIWAAIIVVAVLYGAVLARRRRVWPTASARSSQTATDSAVTTLTGSRVGAPSTTGPRLKRPKPLHHSGVDTVPERVCAQRVQAAQQNRFVFHVQTIDGVRVGKAADFEQHAGDVERGTLFVQKQVDRMQSAPVKALAVDRIEPRPNGGPVELLDVGQLARDRDGVPDNSAGSAVQDRGGGTLHYERHLVTEQPVDHPEHLRLHLEEPLLRCERHRSAQVSVELGVPRHQLHPRLQPAGGQQPGEGVGRGTDPAALVPGHRRRRGSGSQSHLGLREAGVLASELQERSDVHLPTVDSRVCRWTGEDAFCGRRHRRPGAWSGRLWITAASGSPSPMAVPDQALSRR